MWDILPKGNLQYFLQKLKGKLDSKVDAVSGKGLSTNDFTTTEKNKLAGIETGAQVNPTIDSALSDSSTNPVQNKIVKAALDGKADSEEIPTVNNNTITIQLNGTTIESFTLNQTTNETINIQVTKSSVGLGNVPNVGTNDQTPTFTQASTRSNIASGENMATLFGKIKKFFSDLKTVAFTGAYSDLSGQPTKVSQFTNDSGYTTNTGTVTQVKVGSAAYNPSSGVVSLPAYPTSVNYATSAGSAAKGTNNKFETTFLTLGSNGNEPSVTMYNSVSGDGTLKVGINPNDTAMGSSGRNLYLPIGSMYSSNQATLATVEYLNSNFVKWKTIVLPGNVSCAANRSTGIIAFSDGVPICAFINNYNTAGVNDLVPFCTKWYSTYGVYVRNTTGAAITIPANTTIYVGYV